MYSSIFFVATACSLAFSTATCLAQENPQPLAALVDGSRLSVTVKNYAESLEVEQLGVRHSWLQSALFKFESGFTHGNSGVGIDISPFLVLKLDGGDGAGNMVYHRLDGTGTHRRAWAYPGQYAVKISEAGFLFKYGLQTVYNPFLAPYENRSLPPSFRGATLTSAPFHGVSLDAGSFDAMMARGSTELQPLVSSYGGTRISRLSYIGMKVDHGSGRAQLYISRAEDVWDQYYASLSHSINAAHDVRFGAKADLYHTRQQGRSLQGDIDNTAYSVAFNAQHRASTLILAYQGVIGQQYFDFAQETSGIYLANAMSVDFNAPGERSLQLQYKFNGDKAGLPGFQLMAWNIGSWGVDADASARQYAAQDTALHRIYWKNGAPIAGGNREYGIKSSYTVPNGMFKGITATAKVAIRQADPRYPGRQFHNYKITLDKTLQVF